VPLFIDGTFELLAVEPELLHRSLPLMVVPTVRAKHATDIAEDHFYVADVRLPSTPILIHRLRRLHRFD
jgi:hypothetical protein